MHPVIARQLQVVISLLNKPLAEVASFTLDHSVFADRVLLGFDLEVHLVDLLRCESRLFNGLRRLLLGLLRLSLFIIGRSYCLVNSVLANSVSLVRNVGHMLGEGFQIDVTFEG